MNKCLDRAEKMTTQPKKYTSIASSRSRFTKATWWYCIVFLLLIHFLNVVHGCTYVKREAEAECDPGDCMAGQYYKDSQCHTCTKETYMKKNWHQCETCKPCTKLNPGDILIEKSPCTSTSDAVFGCPQGYYETGSDIIYPLLPKCSMCTICGHDEEEVEECRPNKNRVCRKVNTTPNDQVTTDHQNIDPTTRPQDETTKPQGNSTANKYPVTAIIYSTLLYLILHM